PRRLAGAGLTPRRDQARTGRRHPRPRRPRAGQPAGDDEARRPPRARRPRSADAERRRPAARRDHPHRGGPAFAPPRPIPPDRLARAASGRPHEGGAGRRRGRRRAAHEAHPGVHAVKRTFSSFRYRNYRLFFTGQLVSQTGSWMQRIALGWYVLELTHNDAFAVGVMAFAQFLPFTIFGLFAGVVTDR